MVLHSWLYRVFARVVSSSLPSGFCLLRDPLGTVRGSDEISHQLGDRVCVAPHVGGHDERVFGLQEEQTRAQMKQSVVPVAEQVTGLL